MWPETLKSYSPHLPPASRHDRALHAPQGTSVPRCADREPENCGVPIFVLHRKGRGGEEMKFCLQVPTSAHTNTRAMGTRTSLRCMSGALVANIAIFNFPPFHKVQGLFRTPSLFMGPIIISIPAQRLRVVCAGISSEFYAYLNPHLL